MITQTNFQGMTVLLIIRHRLWKSVIVIHCLCVSVCVCVFMRVSLVFREVTVYLLHRMYD